MQFLHWFGNAIQIRFLQKCFSLDALATQIGFQSVFCVTRLSAQHNDDIKSSVTGVQQSGWADSMLLLAIWRTEDKSPWTDTEINCLLHRWDERARFLMLFALKRRATIDVVTDANVATTADWYKVWIHKSNLISCKWQCTESVSNIWFEVPVCLDLEAQILYKIDRNWIK